MGSVLGYVRSKACRVMRLVMSVREEPQVSHNRHPFGEGPTLTSNTPGSLEDLAESS